MIIFLKNEKEFILNKDKSVILFYTENNFLLKILIEKIKKLECEIYLINLNYFKSFVKRFEIKSTPTFVFFKNGKEKKRIEDVILLDKLLELIQKD